MINEVIDKSKKIFDQYEIYLITSENHPISFESNKLKEITKKQTSGFAMRGIKNNRIGLSSTTNPLKFDQLISSLKLKQVFRDYVSLKFNLNYFIRKYHSQAANDNNESSNAKVSFAVSIEFFL